MIESLGEGRRIVFVDETSFTNRTIKKNAFAQLNQNCFIPDGPKLNQQVHLVAAISFENGVESFHVCEIAVNSTEFLKFLTFMYRNNKKLVLFGDNASWHISN